MVKHSHKTKKVIGKETNKMETVNLAFDLIIHIFIAFFLLAGILTGAAFAMGFRLDDKEENK